MLMEKLLPYFEYKSNAEEISKEVDSYVGMNVNSAAQKLKQAKLDYEIVGHGDTVISQAPSSGEIITVGVSKIILYTEKIDEKTNVPKLTGLTLVEAIKTATNAGLNIKISGIESVYPGSSSIIYEQSLPSGSVVKRGSVIVIRAIVDNFED